MQNKRVRARIIVIGGLIAGLAIPATVSAHLERPSYWPDPRADTTVTPAAGGKVPLARSLSSALTRTSGTRATSSNTRVVCQGRGGRTSLKLVKRSIADAAEERLSPAPEPACHPRLEEAGGRSCSSSTAGLRRSAASSSIQKAVDASGNNDRIVIMPGRYTEPKSREAPTNDPRCNPSLLQKDASGDPTPSYEYQVDLPERPEPDLRPGPRGQGQAARGAARRPPRHPRRRSSARASAATSRSRARGVKPEDVILDAGDDYEGKRPRGQARRATPSTSSCAPTAPTASSGATCS